MCGIIPLLCRVGLHEWLYGFTDPKSLKMWDERNCLFCRRHEMYCCLTKWTEVRGKDHWKDHQLWRVCALCNSQREQEILRRTKD